MKNLSYIPVVLLVLLSKMIPFNWIVGSTGLTFSCSTMLAPVIAQQFGLSWISLFFISKNLFSTSCLMMSLLHRTPLLFASRAYQQRHWFTSFLVPALCMMLFIFHDTGRIAWCYSLYWLIPMGLYFVPHSMMSRALSSSFVAHAVGSVIWLYFGNIPASVWLALIPLVACERLLMAAGMVLCDVVITKVRQYSFDIIFQTNMYPSIQNSFPISLGPNAEKKNYDTLPFVLSVLRSKMYRSMSPVKSYLQKLGWA